MKRQIRCLRYLAQAFGACVLLLVLSGWTFPAAPSAANMAFVRLVHASPDVGVVAVFMDGKPMVNGNQVVNSFQFATVTEYVPLPEGSHTVQIAALGKGVNAAMLAQTITVQPGVAYTVAVIGTKATGISFKIFTDDNAVVGNMAKLRVYHLSPGTDPVDITMGTQAVIQGLAYPQVSNYVTLAAGQDTFDLKNSPQNANATFSVMLNPWTVTSVFAIGQLNGSQKLQFVTSQVQGMPNMPNTGSDPNPLPSVKASTTPSTLWLASLLIVLLIGLGTGAGWYTLVLRRRS